MGEADCARKFPAADDTRPGAFDWLRRALQRILQSHVRPLQSCGFAIRETAGVNLGPLQQHVAGLSIEDRDFAALRDHTIRDLSGRVDEQANWTNLPVVSSRRGRDNLHLEILRKIGRCSSPSACPHWQVRRSSTTADRQGSCRLRRSMPASRKEREARVRLS
jgi:hypothetical protein